MNNLQQILDITEDVYNVPLGSIESWCRTRTVAEARAMAQYVIKQECTYSFEELSRIFKRDVSGIKKNCKKIVKLLQDESKVAHQSYNKIVDVLGEHHGKGY